MKRNSLRVNFGCGLNKLDGFLNIDRAAVLNPDLVQDLEQTPWPLEDGQVCEAVFKHSLEHLGRETETFLAIVKELYRVCAPDAIVRITVPHPRHDDYINDPTHVRVVTPALLALFSKKNCLRWAERQNSNTPLALLLDVDFEVVVVRELVESVYLEALGRGELAEVELRQLMRERNNVVKAYEIELRVIKSY